MCRRHRIWSQLPSGMQQTVALLAASWGEPLDASEPRLADYKDGWL